MGKSVNELKTKTIEEGEYSHSIAQESNMCDSESSKSMSETFEFKSDVKMTVNSSAKVTEACVNKFLDRDVSEY